MTQMILRVDVNGHNIINNFDSLIDYYLQTWFSTYLQSAHTNTI